MKQNVLVVGLGEVGIPLHKLVAERHCAFGMDLTPIDVPDRIDVLHVCYPFEIPDFVGETVRYIERYRPELTVINSTVAVGTTRAVAEASGANVVNSPIRGKHARMLEELRIYTKFIGALNGESARLAAEHFSSLGLKIRVLDSPEATELAKLTETTYFGILIAWAQEIERYCDRLGANYDDIVAFFEEIGYLPRVKFFPGVIGGHCVMPNIEILSKFASSELLDAVRSSNDKKIERETRASVNAAR